MQGKVRFIDHQRSPFFSTVTKRVNDYFKQNNLSKHANGEMIFKSVFFLTGIVTFYAMIMSNTFRPLGNAGVGGGNWCFFCFYWI